MVADLPPPKTIDGIINDPNKIVFGSTGVYRVGDGNAADTSCKMEVFSFGLEGVTYTFRFNVPEDDTTVQLAIQRLCGIDHSSNTISIINIDTAQVIVEETLSRRVQELSDVKPMEPFRKPFLLMKGSYGIRVDSLQKENGDHDDFIIGNIRLDADKPIFGTGIETKK